MYQASFFDDEDLASPAAIPAAPELIPHEWPFPGMSPQDSARAAMARSPDYYAMLAAVLKNQPSGELTNKQLLSKVPDDWRAVCGKYAHGQLDFRHGKEFGVRVTFVSHEDGGFHFSYCAEAQPLYSPQQARHS